MEKHAKVSLVICLSFLLDCLFSYYLPAFYVLFKKIRMSVLSSLKTRGEAESFYTWSGDTNGFKISDIDQLILALILRFGVILV